MHLIFQQQATLLAVLPTYRRNSSLRPMPYTRKPFFTFGCLFLLTISSPRASYSGDSPPNPGELVRETVQNALRVNREAVDWSYRELVRKEGRLETREVFQTTAGTLDRLMAIDNQPLSLEQQRKESARIQALLADPAEIHRERQ